MRQVFPRQKESHGHAHPSPGTAGKSLTPHAYRIESLDSAQAGAVQMKTASLTLSNRTGLPDRLKAGIEGLSGLSLDDVRVHFNSLRPAQLQALAYTQGSEIHVGPGQERHLPHEAWHVVQQKQGRVRPIFSLGGAPVNDDKSLEGEADRMGARSGRWRGTASLPRTAGGNHPAVVQRLIGRVEKPKKPRGSADFVKAHEVDLMVEHLRSVHSDQEVVAVYPAGEGAIPITEGEHWFTGHGSGQDFGNLSAEKFYGRLAFDQVPKGGTAILHLISCNLGDIREPAVFAKELRRLIQANPHNEGKIIVIEAAPAFVIHTAALQASFPSKKASKAVAEYHEKLEDAEDEIDQNYAAKFLNEIKPLLESETEVPKLPTKKGFKTYIAGISYEAITGQLSKFTTGPKVETPRQAFIDIITQYAEKNPKQFMRSSHLLAEVLDSSNTFSKFTDIYNKLLAGVEDESKAAWKEFEEGLATIQQQAGGEVLLAGAQNRADIKAKLKEKDPEASARFGWIQYSTKGKHKLLKD